MNQINDNLELFSIVRVNWLSWKKILRSTAVLDFLHPIGFKFLENIIHPVTTELDIAYKWKPYH